MTLPAPLSHVAAHRAELAELLHDLDTWVANEYEETKHAMP